MWSTMECDTELNSASVFVPLLAVWDEVFQVSLVAITVIEWEREPARGVDQLSCPHALVQSFAEAKGP